MKANSQVLMLVHAEIHLTLCADGLGALLVRSPELEEGYPGDHHARSRTGGGDPALFRSGDEHCGVVVNMRDANAPDTCRRS